MSAFTLLFFFIAAAVAWFGFSSIASDIQIIIGLIGLFSAAIFAVLGAMSFNIGRVFTESKRTLRVADRIETKLDQPETKPMGSVKDFSTSLDAYITDQSTPIAYPDAIKHLASQRLKQLGY